MSKELDLESRKLVLRFSIVDSRIDIRSRMSCEAVSGRKSGWVSCALLLACAHDSENTSSKQRSTNSRALVDGLRSNTVDGREGRIPAGPPAVDVNVEGELTIAADSIDSSDPVALTSREWRFGLFIGSIARCAVDIRLVLAAKGDTLAGSSNGGITPSSRASRKAAAQTSFSASHDAASSKLWSRSVSRIE